jgi:hypothetical protein
MTLHVDNLMNTLDVVIELDIERGNLQRNDHVHERYRLAVRQVLETAMAVSPQASAHSPLPPLNFNSDSGGLQEFSPGNGPSANQLLPPSLSSHSIGESPTRYPRGYGIQDATLQSWVSPQSQIDNSTPSVSTQNSMATQWGTPQQLSTPATSTSLDTMGELRDQSTGNSNLHSETPGYALDETLGLPLQTESSEEWEEWRNFASGADISQQSGVEIGVPQLDFGRPRPNEPLLPEDDLGRWQDASDIFANNESLTAILESEIQLPTAGAPIKDHRDRNKGLQAPLYED